jgi:hypothetical protein
MVVEGMGAGGHQVQHIDYQPASKLQEEEQVVAEPAVVAEAKPGDVEVEQVDLEPDPDPAAGRDLGTEVESRLTRSQRRLASCGLG